MISMAMSILNNSYSNNDDTNDNNHDNDNSGVGIADRMTKKEWWDGINGLKMVPQEDNMKIIGNLHHGTTEAMWNESGNSTTS